MMTGGLDDQCLVAACRAGDRSAFGVLVDRYQDRLYPTVLRLTGSPEDAYDLLQEAFLRAFVKLHQFHGESSFYTWIYRIAVNLAISQRRRRRGLRVVTGVGQGETCDVANLGCDSDPSIPVEQAERDALIQNALLALQPDHRAVVVMKDLDGLRYEEIAAILRVPVGTVRSRLHRARCELRDRLKSIMQADVVESPRVIEQIHP